MCQDYLHDLSHMFVRPGKVCPTKFISTGEERMDQSYLWVQQKPRLFYYGGFLKDPSAGMSPTPKPTPGETPAPNPPAAPRAVPKGLPAEGSGWAKPPGFKNDKEHADNCGTK